MKKIYIFRFAICFVLASEQSSIFVTVVPVVTGQGMGEKARKLISEAQKTGDWVVYRTAIWLRRGWPGTRKDCGADARTRV